MQHLCQNNYNVVVIPGVTALITGLVKCAMDASKFVFEGFLSVNKKQRKEKLDLLKSETRTSVFYEAPHKILYTLKDMYEVIGNRKICIARELTKIHEEYIYTTIYDAIEDIEKNGIKGELVLIIEGANKEEIIEEKRKDLENISSRDMVITFMKEEGLNKKDAIKKVVKIKGINKNEVYKEVLDI